MATEIKTINPKSRLGVSVLILLAGIIWFCNLEYVKLFDPDEGRYAEIAREMLASGDWVTPRLNDLLYFEKPPLQYWATAVAFKLFGEHNWTARLWTTLTGFLCVIAIFFASRRLFDIESARYSVLILISSLLFVTIGHINNLDMGVSFFLTLGLIAFLLAQRENKSLARDYWMGGAWAALGLAVLSKGLIGILIPAASLACYSIIQRDLGLWRRLRIVTGLAILLAICAPWFIAVSLAQPEFAKFFFIHEHFERFLTKEHGRNHALWYFVPVIAIGSLPWTILLVDSLKRSWNSTAASANNFSPTRFLLIWIGFIFLFFSVSSSSLPSYILPIIPASALLMGWCITQIDAKALSWQLLPVALLGIALIATAPLIDHMGQPQTAEYYHLYSYWAIAAAIIFFIAVFSGFCLLRYDRKKIAITFVAFGGFVAAQVIYTGYNMLAPDRSGYSLAQQIQSKIRPETKLYSVATYSQSLTYYLKHTMTLVAYQDEFAFGISQEPFKQIPDIASFVSVWNAQSGAIAVMAEDTYASLKEKNLPMQVIGRTSRYIVVEKP